MSTQDSRVKVFRALHERGCFVIPNPWDAGSARVLAGLGFKALASTSSGMAWSHGKPDNHVSLQDVLAHLRAITSAVELPVNADFEGGFAREPRDVAVNVTAALATGIAGISIEDSTGIAENPLFEFSLAVERVRAAREAIEESGTRVLLTGRSEGFITGRPDIDETVQRLRAFADAGAECLYAPGIRTVEHIRAVVDAVAPKPVNLLVSGTWITVEQAAALGIRRISVGGALARAAWAGFLRAAREIAGPGTFGELAKATPGDEMNALFDSYKREL